jgi:hypothetical protein
MKMSSRQVRCAPNVTDDDRGIITLDDHRGLLLAPHRQLGRFCFHRSIHCCHGHAARSSALPRERFSPLAQSRHAGGQPKCPFLECDADNRKPSRRIITTPSAPASPRPGHKAHSAKAAAMPLSAPPAPGCRNSGQAAPAHTPPAVAIRRATGRRGTAGNGAARKGRFAPARTPGEGGRARATSAAINPNNRFATNRRPRPLCLVGAADMLMRWPEVERFPLSARGRHGCEELFGFRFSASSVSRLSSV